MDHLPVIEHRRSVRVKYREHTQYGYDQKGFLGFPKRKRIDEKALIDHGKHGLDADSFKTFIQAWLFWGLLSEFMLPQRKVDFDLFLVADETFGRAITTKALMPQLAVWRRSLLTIKDPTYLMRLNLVVTTARLVIRSFSAHASPEWPSKWAGAWPLSHDESLVIRALGETLQWALIQAEGLGTRSVLGWTIEDERGWGLGMYDRNDLTLHGFCPYDFVFPEGLLNGSICGFYYASSIRSIKHDEEMMAHERCNVHRCVAETFVGPYKTRHVPECSGLCTFLEPDHHTIVQTIVDDGIPVLTYVEDPPSLGVSRHSPGLPYVVISHVWAEGLGNPEGNAMVSCQMQRLAALVNKFSEFQGQSVGFWIDSICVPINAEHKPARKKAIEMMFDIYTGAYATIVLSADLMDCEAHQTAYLEPAMRIATSNWMRRLWTFQEGAMSRNLYFLFADGLRNVEDLEALYPRAAFDSVSASSARSFYTTLLRPRTFDRKADAEMVSAVYRAVQWRTTSRPSDECLALARVLNINSPLILDPNNNNNSRMEALLRNLADIPSGLMFMPGARLERSPFRWAPATWMVGTEIEYPDPFLVTKATQLPTGYSITIAQSVLTDRGLLVRYPGFLLHRNRKPHAKPSELFPARFPTEISLRQWYQVQSLNLSDEEVKGLLQEGSYEVDTRTDLGIICCRPNPGIVPETAILVLVTGKSQGTLHCRWVDRVRINLITLDSMIEKLQRLFTTTDYFWHWYFGETLSPDQLWTVD